MNHCVPTGCVVDEGWRTWCLSLTTLSVCIYTAGTLYQSTLSCLNRLVVKVNLGDFCINWRMNDCHIGQVIPVIAVTINIMSRSSGNGQKDSMILSNNSSGNWKVIFLYKVRVRISSDRFCFSSPLSYALLWPPYEPCVLVLSHSIWPSLAGLKHQTL